MVAAGPSDTTRGIYGMSGRAVAHCDVESADVELLDVRRDFDTVVAVADVSLAIGRGEFFSLLGPSGCGKTTILRMIGGFETPTAGEIRIRGKRVDGIPANRRPTNMVFQQLALFPHLSVFENVAFGLRLKGVSKHAISRCTGDALAMVGLEGLAARNIAQISGGQQQRVALARALVNEPAVLLLDEPFAALDVKLRLQMQAELKALQNRLGTTFVFVTHDQGEAFAISDRIAVMNGGRIEQVGTPRGLYDRPSTRFVASFVGDTNLLEGRITAIGAGLARVDCGRLTIEAPSSGCEVGDTVTISLRPEDIEVAHGAARDGRRAAEVRAAVFQGPYIKLTLALDGLSLRALAPTGTLAEVRAGDMVAIGWRAERASIMKVEP
jgi:ABC-type Fe3+/spermidine/putrescine transport system ATPase subunit